MLRDQVDYVIGVDTHKQTHSAAVLDTNGALLNSATAATNERGYGHLLALAVRHAPGRRVWAIEGTGSFGALLTTFLLEHGEWVVELDRPTRPARRDGAKSDELDAARAGREAPAREHLAQPRRRGEREAIRVLLTTRAGAVQARTKAINHLKHLVVSAPPPLRQRLRDSTTFELVRRCARLTS